MKRTFLSLKHKMPSFTVHVFLHWLLKSEVVWKNISNSGRHRLHHICYNHQSKLDFRLMCLSCCSSTLKVAICFESCSSAQRSAHSEPPLHSFKAWLWLHDWKRGQMLKYLKNKTTDLKMKRIITRLWSSPSALWSILASLSWLFWFLELLTVQSYLSSDHK